MVDYHAGRGRLSYRVGVVDGKTTCLTAGQFHAQLDHLQELAGLNRRANPVQSAPGLPFDTPEDAHLPSDSSRASVVERGEHQLPHVQDRWLDAVATESA